MAVLIIYVHPETKGFNSRILATLTGELDRRQVSWRLIDLYRDSYHPVLRSEEHFTAGNRQVAEQTREYQELVKQHDKLVLIYPVWWNGPPAILKGFFDRVFTPGFAYRFNGRIPGKLLKGKKAAVLLTHGSPGWYTTFILRNRGAKVVVRDILGFCGIASKFFKLNNARHYGPARDREISRLVDKAMGYLLK